jgi:hypothetical protein
MPAPQMQQQQQQKRPQPPPQAKTFNYGDFLDQSIIE